MEQVKLTKVDYEVLDQNNFKNIAVWKVENTQNNYLRMIRNCDYYQFILKLITIKLNKDGSVPNNINRSLAIKGGTFDQNFWEKHNKVAYNYVSKDKKKYAFYLKYDGLYIDVACVLLNDKGQSYGVGYSLLIRIDREKLKSLGDLEKVCRDELEHQKQLQKQYISGLKNTSKVAKQLEKVNYFEICKSRASEWIA